MSSSGPEPTLDPTAPQQAEPHPDSTTSFSESRAPTFLSANAAPAEAASASGGEAGEPPSDSDLPSRRYSSQEKGKGKEVRESSDEQEGAVAAAPAPVEPSSSAPPPPKAMTEPLAEAEAVPPAPASPTPPPVPPREEENEEKWKLKAIHWPPLPAPPSGGEGQADVGPVVKIVTQDVGGPCSLISVANLLVLRGEIAISPPERTHVSYSDLSALIAEHLLSRTGTTADGSLSAALAQLPLSRHGLDVNPIFHAVDAFKQSSETSGELALFRLAGIELLHGWLADMEDEEQWSVLEEVSDYDNATMKLVEASEITGGVDPTTLELQGDEEALMAYAERASKFTPQQGEVVRKAVILNKFLRSSQLTYPGLVSLHAHLAPSAVAVLFFGSHLSVVFKRPTGTGAPEDETQLFTLVTDAAFAHESQIVWESLNDVDGASSSYYSANLRPAQLARGDWTRRRAGREEEDDVDGSLALARQLQQEEEEEVRQRQAAWEEEERARMRAEQDHHRGEQRAPPPPPPPPASAKPTSRKLAKQGDKGNKEKCVVM